MRKGSKLSSENLLTPERLAGFREPRATTRRIHRQRLSDERDLTGERVSVESVET